VPLRWAGVRHSLQTKILGLEGIDQRFTAMTHLVQGLQLQGTVSGSPGTLRRPVLRRSILTINSPVLRVPQRLRSGGQRWLVQVPANAIERLKGASGPLLLPW
jgi:hypothetical protein